MTPENPIALYLSGKALSTSLPFKNYCGITHRHMYFAEILTISPSLILCSSALISWFIRGQLEM
jgi:hypothetical protein